MDLRTEITQPQLKENLKGRIANLSLLPNYSNSLIPLFEAITNSIDAIKEKYNDDSSQGVINILVKHDENRKASDFEITDDGIGLNAENFNSFLTYDSYHKIEKGGKGVGRLTWLKSFEKIKVESVYENNGGFKKRQFDFILDNEKALQNCLDMGTSKNETETKISLTGMLPEYRKHCSLKLENIAERILSHFLTHVLDNTCPMITVSDEKDEIKVNDLVDKKIYSKEEGAFSIENLGDFTITHMRIDKSITSEIQKHTLSYSANSRIVKIDNINNKIGVAKAIDFEGKECFYRGVIESDFLDENVRQERNNFDIADNFFTEIEEEAIFLTKSYLKKEIDEALEGKLKKTKELLRSHPRYKYLMKTEEDVKIFTGKLPENAIKEEEIFFEISKMDYKENKRIKKEINSASNQLAINQDEIDKLMYNISQQQQYTLAEYVAKRKIIIDLFEQRLRYEDTIENKNYKEECLHELICPLKRNSDSAIDCRDHNLWLIDDRLTYYDYWASDKQINSFIEDSTSRDRPDVILFDGANLFKRSIPRIPAVIVEFKRPGKDDYNLKENPFIQIYNYVDELRGKKAKDNKGAMISEIGENDLIHCYFICDINDKMEKMIKDNLNGAIELTSGRGYHCFHSEHGIYFEILNFKYIIEDARLRNETFFNKLGIT